MTLHIKLPRKKVSRACELIAEHCSGEIARSNVHYCDAMVSWRDRESCIESLPIKPDLTQLLQKRAGMESLVDMCSHAVGCVYVSPELWKVIQRWYK